ASGSGANPRGSNDVVHHFAITWPDFHSLHPTILGKTRGNGDVLIRDFAVCRNMKSIWDLNDDIGLADPPSLEVLHRFRRHLWIALRSTAISPSCQRIYLGLRE